MVKTYKYDDKTQLTPHFNVQEFRCKCGRNHDTLLSEELVNKLEEIYAKLNCSKIIISSGYRCIAHDKAVGGSGGGYHTKGMAADYCCYDQKGNIISTKIVSCVAQDLGLGGIANINQSYTYIHSDVRTGYRWFGNEIINYNTVTSDFYKYYGLTKQEVEDFCNKYKDEDTEPVEEPKDDVVTPDPINEPVVVPEPDPNKNPYNEPSELISEKSSGDSVRWLQWELTRCGFYNDEVSGVFDIFTYGALLAFQKKNGLTVDALCGNQTKKAIKNYKK